MSVLRDTGSNTLVVRRSLLPDKALTGTTAKLVLADGSSIKVPKAEVEILSPYFSGTSIVKCMTAPLYDIIIGNVPGSREVHDTDKAWKEGLMKKKPIQECIASGRRTKGEDHSPDSLLVGIKSREQQPKSSKVDISALKITREDLTEAQDEDLRVLQEPKVEAPSPHRSDAMCCTAVLDCLPALADEQCPVGGDESESVNESTCSLAPPKSSPASSDESDGEKESACSPAPPSTSSTLTAKCTQRPKDIIRRL
ncbi:hypothetical protein HPB49_010467 [Dermacentor silvarum]|uniref:Uncharacterized protein n=1 Tax=Dermacentor silvarum TaxID=543639 RepID=A0ACB8D4I8_DERSI|nr:hypothetical protein HPB49_010467 [Dermacentor silvarum]